MPKVRLIARLDIKGPNLIKGIQLEGVRVVGDPYDYAVRYYEEGVDEILYMDAVASLYDRDMLAGLVARTARDVFVPITVGGGLRALDDVKQMLRAGADKVAINSAATLRPDFIREVAEQFGSQCMVLQIDAKRNGPGRWEAYRDGGREHTGHDAVEWAVRGQQLGAGEILLTSVDCEGMRRGFDIDLAAAVTKAVSIPVIISGGMGDFSHLAKVVEEGRVDAVAMAYVLHYRKLALPAIRGAALSQGINVRSVQ